MEFKGLPSDIQRIAGHTLAAAIKELGTDIKSEPAKELAHNIKAAFVALYSEDSAKQHKDPVAGSGFMSQADGSSAAYSSNAQTKI